MQRERVEKTKSQARREELQRDAEAKKLDMADVLADIDVALQGIDQSLAENYVQRGGE